MSQTNLTKSTRIQREMAEQLIDMFGFSHPHIFTQHLDRLFLAWNITDEADDSDIRESMQFTVQMMKDFFFIFSKEDPENVAKALLEVSNLNPIENED